MRLKSLRPVAIVIMTLLLLVSTTVLAAPYGSRTLSSGTFGGDVVVLQRRLSSLGYRPGVPDGVFGATTRLALIRFQQDYGLIGDGLAGKWTFRAVDRAYSWQQGFDYAVRRGDSLYGIARAHGTTVDTLFWLNRLRDSMLYPGQVLRMPNTGQRPAAPPPAPKPAPTPAPAPSPAPPPAVPSPPPGPVTPPPDPTTGSGQSPAPLPAPVPAPGTAPVPPWIHEYPTVPAPVPVPLPVPAPVQVPPPVPVSVPVPPPVPDPVPVPPPDSTQRPPLMILGYYAEDWQGDSRALTSLKRSQGQVNMVVNFQLEVDATGAVKTRDYPELMAEAQRQGLKVQGLLHNYSQGTFDAGIARAVLADAAVRSRLIANLMTTVREKGLSGINVDIENVQPDLRPSYTAFVRELGASLHGAGHSLTLSIPAKTWDDTTSAWSGAFDYKALGQVADYLVPMAYDENLPGYQAGPVASIGWVEKVAAFSVSQVPREKVLLGVPAYAYDFRRSTTEGQGLSVTQAMERAIRYSAQVQWDPQAKVPFYTYVNNGQERIVYFENAQSLAAKLDLVRKYGLAGIGIWRLGLEDPAIWTLIQERFR